MSRLVSLLAALMVTGAVHATAPVVDESDNYTAQDAWLEAEEPALIANIADAGEQPDNSILLEKLQGLQQELQELRGQLELQAHEIDLLQQRQKVALAENATLKMLEDEKTLSNPEISLPNPGTPAIIEAAATRTIPPARIRSNNPAEAQIRYLAAYEFVKNKKYDEALAAFDTFIQEYGQNGYTANALYWTGEIQMIKKNYPEAIKNFETVVQQYPSSGKSAASLLKIGYALAASNRKTEARQRLQQVVRSWPDTPTAALASNKLATLERQ